MNAAAGVIFVILVFVILVLALAIVGSIINCFMDLFK